jgi:arylsulfatase
LLAAVITACSDDSSQPITAPSKPAGQTAVVDQPVDAVAESGEFKGKIAKKYEDSQEWWPEEVRPKEGAPNVIIFLLDDVGFAQFGSFGGLIETHNIDQLASNGLRYNNFHTTAL